MTQPLVSVSFIIGREFVTIYTLCKWVYQMFLFPPFLCSGNCAPNIKDNPFLYIGTSPNVHINAPECFLSTKCKLVILRNT